MVCYGHNGANPGLLRLKLPGITAQAKQIFSKTSKHFASDADSHPNQNEERLESLKMQQFHVLDTAFAEKSLYVMQDDCVFVA